MSKIRIDDYLVKEKFLNTKDEVMRYVMAGQVFINEIKISSPALKLKEEEIKDVRIKRKEKPYASRGGYKLEKAINYWDLNFKDKDVLDVGSSTGGFTSCALKFGSKSVYALDVGTNQLIYELRTNEKVKVFEQTNFRTIDENFFDKKFDYITMDVSFISITLLLKNVKKYLKDNGVFIVLIKPQFEANKDVKRDKNGVITDSIIHKEVIENIKTNCLKKGLEVEEVIASPISGTKGNKEFLAKVVHKGE